MKEKVLLLAAACAWPSLTLAAQPTLGTPTDGGLFLYREKVEIYWNDWVAYPIMANASIPTQGQARATVVGDGKTASFIGNLSINCENGQHYWESAGSDSEFLTSSDQADQAVPREVISKATALLCSK